MSVDLTSSTVAMCGAAGCRNDATAFYLVPRKGRRALCSECDDGFEVIRRV